MEHRFYVEQVVTKRRSWCEINDRNIVGDPCIGVIYNEATADLIVDTLNAKFAPKDA